MNGWQKAHHNTLLDNVGILHNKKNLLALKRLLIIVVCLSPLTPVYAALGEGWTEYFPNYYVHVEGSEDSTVKAATGLTAGSYEPNNYSYSDDYTSYSRIDGIETFTMVANEEGSRQRIEARIADDFNSGIYQFDGEVWIEDGADGVCLHQVWLDTMITIYDEDGGNLREHSYHDLITGAYGRWVRVTTIFDKDNDKIETWIDGVKELEDKYSDDGTNFYHKYGLYNGAASSPTAKWRNIRYFKDGSFPEAKTTQTISFPAIGTRALDDADFSPNATASSNLPITYTSSNTSVAKIVDGKVRIVGLGTTFIDAYQEGNSKYSSAIKQFQKLVVTEETSSAENLAYLGNATQSSTTNGGDADKAIDGNTSGLWTNSSITHTSTESKPWWQVELTAQTAISEIIIFDRTDSCCSSRLKDFTVSVVNAAGDTTFSQQFDSSPDPSMSIDAAGAIGKVVKIQLNGDSSPLSLAEVEIYADDNSLLPEGEIYYRSDEQESHVAESILDGDTSDDSRWSAAGFPQTVIIDYGEDKNIFATNVSTYQDRAYQYTIELSQSPESGYTEVVNRSTNTESGENIRDTFEAVKARYLKLNVTGASDYSGSWVSITEITVEEAEEGMQETIVTADKDAYIRGGDYADSSYGLESKLLVKSNSKESYTRKSYIRFNINEIANLDVEKAVVRLYASRVDSAQDIGLYRIVSNDENEADITWNNMPVEGSLISSTSVTTSEQYYEWDVTDYLTEKLGYKTFSILLKDPNNSDEFIYFNSREGDEHTPQLLIYE